MPKPPVTTPCHRITCNSIGIFTCNNQTNNKFGEKRKPIFITKKVFFCQYTKKFADLINEFAESIFKKICLLPSKKEEYRKKKKINKNRDSRKKNEKKKMKENEKKMKTMKKK